ncbi:hypothetical protein PsYK624_038600 [Phanerochaete sordida]|uniref:BTB domain-containing protein n=1 Tax=Phanerochaete sordida TaxID=48140 RepID=A0A9P3LBF4_9APHY|nr:hypothetical protein PsYK624_038600 [Phanerochaete sordida]
MTASSLGFHCERPDFTVRSVPDGDEFLVRRECLAQGSEVFRDMFHCCDASTGERVLELQESAPSLSLLFQLLHNTPEPYVPPDADKPVHVEAHDYVHIQQRVPAHAIPFPLLPTLFVLADKYACAPAVMQACFSHLAAYASTHPLRVYGMAVGMGHAAIAAKASKFLLHPPLTSYTTDEIKSIPTAEAYHRLVLLHEHRIKRLREILIDEPIFPQRYGECSKHTARTKRHWEARKGLVIPRVAAATDVAAEMTLDVNQLAGCETCFKAWVAATAMLGYKCSKVPRRIDKLPTSVTQPI